MEEQDNYTNDEERIIFPGESPVAPPHLEERIVNALKKNSLIMPGKINRLSPVRVAAGIVFAAGIFLGGWLLGSKQVADTGSTSAPSYEQQYLLLTYDPANFITDKNHVAEYGKWAMKYGGEGYIASGAELKDAGWIIKDDGLSLQDRGMTGDGQGYISGYFIINAPSDSKAIEIASTCPHLDHNGILELRSIH